MDIKAIWRDPVWSKVISAAIIAITVSAGTFVLARWSGPFSNALSATWAYVVGDAVIPRWMLAGICAWAVAASYVLYLVALITKESKAVQKSQITWTSYVEDEFLNLRWRWQINSSARVFSLTAYCVSCDMELTDTSDGFGFGDQTTIFECANCNKPEIRFDEPIYEVKSRVTKLIQLAARNGSWQQARRKGQLIFAGTE
jgi:hypothetical protein